MSLTFTFRLFAAILAVTFIFGVQSPLFADESDTFVTFKDCKKLKNKDVRYQCYESFADGKTFSQKKAAVEEKRAFGAVKSTSKHAPNAMEVTIVSIKKLMNGRLVFTTQDGQVWKQSNSKRFKNKKLPYQAIIKKKIMATYGLSPIGSNSSVTVKRVK